MFRQRRYYRGINMEIKVHVEPFALKAFIFWSADDTSWLTPFTIRVTGGQLPDKSDTWSHMGLGFELAGGKTIYYENLFRDGFRGPKPIEELIAFRNAGGRLSIQPVDGLTVETCESIRDRCEAWADKRRGYYHWQLIAMWYFERFLRFYHRHIQPSPDRGVCSEDVARLLHPFVELRDTIRDFDEVNPNSAWRQWLNIKGGSYE